MKISDIFKPVDQKKFDIWQLKSLLISGMGIFTDGYDLSGMGIVLPFILASFNLTSKSPNYVLYTGLITGTVLIGAAVGAIIFGFLGNKGRTKYYGIEMVFMTVGALLAAFVTTPLELILVRFILGFGLGADYVLSTTIMAEHTGIKNRGKVMALGFGKMYGIGGSVAAAITLALEAAGVPSNILWRVVLALGAIPAALVVYSRRKIPETPRYLLRIKGDNQEFKEVMKTLAKTDVQVDRSLVDVRTFSDYFAKFGKIFITIALLWFLTDVISYASFFFGPSLIAKSVGINNGAIFQFIIEFGFVIPGGLVQMALIDKIGKKPLMMLGYIGIAVSLLMFSGLKALIPAFLALIMFGMSHFSSSLGPGAIAGMLGVELAPTKVRTLVQAMAVSISRMGGALTSFVFPFLFSMFSESVAIGFLSAVAFIAVALTFFIIPETKGKALEEASGEELIPLNI